MVGSTESWVQNTNVLVKGMSVGRSCFVVWSGKDARAFRLDFSLMRLEALDPFQTPGFAIACADSNQIIEVQTLLTLSWFFIT